MKTNQTEKISALLEHQKSLVEQSTIVDFKLALEKWKILIEVARESEAIHNSGVWMTKKDGTFVHFESNHGCFINVTQHPELKHQSYNFAQGATGEHFVFEFNLEHTEVVRVESHNTKKMQKKISAGRLYWW
ncbi:hypothetical protein HYV64_01825 [Candidatus Shapirobacteria bacterium]|nr:hypothetical protein [Candidatus Shapirobacteria bacterium]